MLSLVNLSVQNKEKFVIKDLNATFSNGYIYGLYAQDTTALQMLAECIEGRRSIHAGAVLSDNREPHTVYYSLWNNFAHNRQLIQEQLLCASGDTPSMHFNDEHHYFSKPVTNRDCSLYLLHDINSTDRETNEACSDFLKQEAAVNGKTVLITGSDYRLLRELSDYIYVFDNKQFQVKIEKRDYHLFDHYLENVFRD